MPSRIRHSHSLIGETISFLTPRHASAWARPFSWLRNAYISERSAAADPGNTCMGPRKKCAVGFSMTAASCQALPPAAFMLDGWIGPAGTWPPGYTGEALLSLELHQVDLSGSDCAHHNCTVTERKGVSEFDVSGSGREDGLRRPCFQLCRRTGSRSYRDGCKFYTR